MASIDDKKAHFGSLAQRLSLDAVVQREFPEGIVFDHFCPKAQDCIVKQTCKHCGRYDATQKLMHLHAKCHKRRRAVTARGAASAEARRPS